MSLGHLPSPDLRVHAGFRSVGFRVGGATVATLRVQRSPLDVLTQKALRSRVLRLEVEGPELDTVWRAEVGGHHVGDVVHLFPHNVLTPTGTPPGRGYEVRTPKGKVLGFTDQTGRFLSPSLLFHDGSGALQVRVVLGALRTRLSFQDPEGGPLMDLMRRIAAKESWRAMWLRPDLDEATREVLGASLLVTLLWAPRT